MGAASLAPCAFDALAFPGIAANADALDAVLGVVDSACVTVARAQCLYVMNSLKKGDT